MFKKATVVRIVGVAQGALGAGELERSLQACVFSPTQPTQARSVGFVPVRGFANGALLEVVDGCWIAKLRDERRTVPAAAVKRRQAQLVAELERRTRKVASKRERSEAKADALHELLPTAHPKTVDTFVWIDPKRLRMVVGATGRASLDLYLSTLTGVGGFGVAWLRPLQSPALVLQTWVRDEPPGSFVCGGEGELFCPETHARVRYTVKPLSNSEASAHLTEGKQVSRLGVAHGSGLEFVVDARQQTLVLHKLSIEGLSAAKPGEASGDDGEQFDADVVLITRALGQAIDEYLEHLGGEAPEAAGDAAAADAAAGESVGEPAHSQPGTDLETVVADVTAYSDWPGGGLHVEVRSRPF